MFEFVIAAVVLVAIVVMAKKALAKPRTKPQESFDPARTLAEMSRLVHAAADQVATARRWDQETATCSAAQVYGYLTKGVLNACKATGQPEPSLNDYDRQALRAAEHPLLSTSSTIFARLSALGVVPREFRSVERSSDSFMEDMAERVHDAPIRQALGLLPFRIDPGAESQETASAERVHAPTAIPVVRSSPSIQPFKSSTDVDQFVRACHALAAELPSRLRPVGGPRLTIQGTSGPVDPIAAYLDEVSLAFAYGICCFVACIHNQQWPKSKGCVDARMRVVTDLTSIQLRDSLDDLPEQNARMAADETTAKYLEHAKIAAHMCWKQSNDEGHELIRALADFKVAKAPAQRRRSAPTGKEVLSKWLGDPTSAENHLVYVQILLGKAVGAEYTGSQAKEGLEALYGELTREMITLALQLLNAPLPESKASNS